MLSELLGQKKATFLNQFASHRFPEACDLTRQTSLQNDSGLKYQLALKGFYSLHLKYKNYELSVESPSLVHCIRIIKNCHFEKMAPYEIVIHLCH